ncbi:MAG: hypothetical protein WC975_08625 [Phycisphaerae bacterium]
MNMSKKQKIGLTVLLTVVGVSVLTAGIYYTWLITPLGPPKTAAEGVKTLTSARFKRLPEYRKIAYMEQTQNLVSKLPENQRHDIFRQMGNNEASRNAMREAMMAMMTKQAVDYAKAPPADRLKILDAAIDREEQMRSRRGQRRPRDNTTAGERPGRPGGQGIGNPGGPGPGGPGRPGGQGGGRGPGNFRARMQQMAEHGNPQQMALMVEFRHAMQQRRAQRGLSTGRP